MSADFGFDVQNVFGSARKGRKGKSKKKKDSMDMMMEGSFGGMGLGIDTFSLADPNIDALSLGSDFGDVVGSRAGLANGKRGGFLDIIGSAQFGIPAVTGKGAIARGRGKGRKTKARTPLQRSTGSRFGEVDREFAGNVIGNIRGARKRISDFRAKRKRSKTKSTRDPPQLEFKERPIQARDSTRPQPALPPPKPTTRELLPRETGSQAIARLREESSSRRAT
jgi:hypothetical protein